MKKFTFLIAFIVLAFSVKAQDVIVLRNAIEVQAKVEAIGQNEITYRKWDNLKGPTYIMAKSEIFFIKYENGNKDTFVEYKSNLAPSDKKAKVSKPKFQGHTYLGADFSSGFGGPSLDFSFGARMTEFLYLGGGVSCHNLAGRTYVLYEDGYSVSNNWFVFLPLTFDTKWYIPTRVEGFYPRFDLSVGTHLRGFYWSTGYGFDYNMFSFGVGLQMPIDRMSLNGYYPLVAGYVRLGICFGKKKK